ncbi:MAG: hypothetical protein RJA34_2960 [Pseudomonadota bacterium]|jgi:LacI family transcriptional regulator
MSRTTIRDVAQQAQVSVATVNRVIAGHPHIKPLTLQRVLQAAQQVGFYGLGAMQHRAALAEAQLKLGVFIQTPHLAFSQALADGFEQACLELKHVKVYLHLEQVADLSPEAISERITAMGRHQDAMCVQAADHPMVAQAIDDLQKQGKPVVAIVSPLSASSHVSYVGLDSWKVGRTAAWAFEHLCHRPGKLAMFVGTHRFRCHDLFESGFRSFVREFMPERTLLEPLATYESDANARELTEKLLREHPDLAGLYVSGGGVAGAIAALRDLDLQRQVLLVGHDVLPSTRSGLMDGRLAMVIAHPYQAIAQAAIQVALRAREQGPDAGGQRVYVPFNLVTRENL